MENINTKRILSFIIDLTISSFLGNILLSLLSLDIKNEVYNIQFWGKIINYGYSYQFFIILTYFIMFDLLNHGNSFGKLIFSISIRNKNNLDKPIKILLIKRTFLKMLSIIILPISIYLFLFKKGFTIQDKFTNTINIKT